MYDRLMGERNFNQLSNEEAIKPLDPNSEEFMELQFHFNTLFNDTSKRYSSSETVFEIEKVFSLINQHISLNFEKREKNEVSSYGWFTSDITDDKRIDELVNKLRTKGPESINKEIRISGAPANDDNHNIIFCKFLIGESEVIFQDDPFTEAQIEQYRNSNYDSIVRVFNTNTKDNTRRYKILKEENIELLYLIKIREVEFQSQLIECSSQICPYNEANNDLKEKEKKEEKKNIYYCLLKDNYFCNGCHKDIHQKEVIYGSFDTTKCEEKIYLNLQGECPNKELHPNKKNFDADYFCTDCLKGICSYCKVYGSEKHPDLRLITDLFNQSKLKDKDNINKDYTKLYSVYTDILKDLNKKIVGLQNNTQKIGDDLREFVSVRFNDLFKEIDKKFTDEGERLVSICYQLNLLRDNITFYHNAYLNKEILLLNNNLKQELLWTKMTHMDHLLYLFELKENIKTKFTVNKKEYEHIINSYLAEIDNEINSTFIDITKSDIKKEDDDETITVKTLVENAKISLEGSANK